MILALPLLTACALIVALTASSKCINTADAVSPLASAEHPQRPPPAHPSRAPQPTAGINPAAANSLNQPLPQAADARTFLGSSSMASLISAVASSGDATDASTRRCTCCVLHLEICSLNPQSIISNRRSQCADGSCAARKASMVSQSHATDSLIIGGAGYTAIDG